MSMRHLKQLGQGFQISMPTDENGLVGRECPNPECIGYFKIKLGTGLKGENLPCHCPYCGHTAGQDQFWTQEQIEYARSVALRKISAAFKQDIKDWDRRLRQKTRGGFVQLRVEYKGRPHPIRYYEERELETRVVCDQCTLEYAIYGVFAYCPDCGTHNSLQILNKNLELAEKQIHLAATQEREFAEYLIADALENAVSAFDGFGRTVCALYADAASAPQKVQNISFQNLVKADKRVQDLFGFSFATSLNVDEWAFTCQCFQKRHLFAHKMGVVDQAYIDATGDTTAIVGRKVSLSSDQVTSLIQYLKQIASYLVVELSTKKG